MGNRREDRSTGNRNDEIRRGGPGRPAGVIQAHTRGGPENRNVAQGPENRGMTQGRAPGRVFDRNEDMGGSGWSGASGRGGMSYELGGPRGPERGGPSFDRENGHGGQGACIDQTLECGDFSLRHAGGENEPQ